MFIICVFVGLLLYTIPNKRIEPKVGLIIIFKPCYNFIVKYCPGQNFIIKFNEILSMDDISYEILSHGHYFIEDNILWYKTTKTRDSIGRASVAHISFCFEKTLYWT
jgi:hypothetical protein